MKNICVRFLHLLKNIGTDVLFLYKNFFHWNISKFLILIASFVVGLLLSLPFFILLLILALIDPIEWSKVMFSDINIYMSIAQYIAIHPFYLLAEFILFVIWVALLFLWMSYHIILESNLYLHYFKKEKLPVKKNFYFDASKIYTYFGILSWLLAYLMLPILVLLWVFIVLFIGFKFFFLPEILLSVILFIALAICAVWFLYLSYRISFAYLVFVDQVDENEPQKSRSYVQKSLALTSWKVFFKFFSIIIIFTILLAPINLIGANMENNINEIRNYFWYKSGQVQIVDESDQFEYEYLRWLFSEKTDDELISDLQTLYFQQVVYTLLFFLLCSWVLTMIMTSFYKRALVMQWSKVKKEDKKEKKNEKLKNIKEEKSTKKKDKTDKKKK